MPNVEAYWWNVTRPPQNYDWLLVIGAVTGNRTPRDAPLTRQGFPAVRLPV